MMNILAIKADGEYCPVESYRKGGPWVPSDDTNIAHVFAREIARLRDESVKPLCRMVKRDLLDVYGQVERDDWLEPGGFK